MNQRFYFPLALVAVMVVSFLIVQSSHPSTDTYFQVQAAPKGANITIDGGAAGAGKNEINPGAHSITASRSGFAAQTRKVVAVSGKTAYVGFILEPNSMKTQDWYNKHSSDQTLSQSIIDQVANYQTTAQAQTNPFLRLLPLTYGDGQGGQVTIAQGVPLPNGTEPAIYVRANNPAARQGVLQYMRSRGYDPATMDMEFYGVVDPLEEEHSEGNT